MAAAGAQTELRTSNIVSIALNFADIIPTGYLIQRCLFLLTYSDSSNPLCTEMQFSYFNRIVGVHRLILAIRKLMSLHAE